MTLLILRDSVVLFLLAYSVMELCLCLFERLRHKAAKPADSCGMYVINAGSLTACQAECLLRASVFKYSEPIWVLTEYADEETLLLLQKLSLDFPSLQLCSKDELFIEMTRGKAPAASLKNEPAANPSPCK